jgi:hypothetical protein
LLDISYGLCEYGSRGNYNKTKGGNKMFTIKKVYVLPLVIAASVFVVSGAFFTFIACENGDDGAKKEMDLHIDVWGNPPGTVPPYTNEDIYVDNDGDGKPDKPTMEKGYKNKLFARVENIGTGTAKNVVVKFSFAPFGLGLPSAFFIDIGKADNPPNLSPGVGGDYQVDWELDPTAVVWSNLGNVGDYDHFCVKVEVSGVNEDGTKEINDGDNKAQSNFTYPNRVMANEPFSFLVGNPNKDAITALIKTSHKSEKGPGEYEYVDGVPEGWTIAMEAEDGIDLLEEGGFTLGGEEVKLGKATVMTPVIPLPPPEPGKFGPVEISVSLYIDEADEPHSGITFTVVTEESR